VTGVKRRKWVKYKGNPILPKVGVGPSAPCVLDMGDNTYRMYYHTDLSDGTVGINLALANFYTPCEWSESDKNPIFRATLTDPNAGDGHMVRYCRVVRVAGPIWYMYYTGMPRQSGKGKLNWNPGMAVSKDGGLTWKRSPKFRLPHGSKDIAYSAEGVVGTFVWAPEQSREAGMQAPWNMWYTAFEREAWPTMLVGICHAWSPDGIRWVNNPKNPILRADDPFRSPEGREKRLQVEKEFSALEQGKDEFADIPLEERKKRCLQLHEENSRIWCTPWLIYEDGILRMWHTKWGVEKRPYRICYAESTDGVHWDTDIRDIELDVSESGFDSNRTEYPCVIKTDTEWRLWYSGDGYAGIGYASASLE